MRRSVPVAGGALLLVALIGAAAPVAAQSTALDRTDSLIAAGRIDEARGTLQAWWDERGEEAPASERQRALWLRGKLTIDPSLARRDYMRLVLEHPGGPHSDDALLRLAQGAEAEGRRSDAAASYEQLLREYPDSPHRLEARRWLDAHREEVARARILGADRGPAEDDAGPPGPGGGVAEEPPETGADRDADPSGEAEPDRRGPVALQLGAFRSERGARAMAREARSAGFDDVRLVRVEESDLLRVRVGRFPDRASADARRRAVEARGFDVVVVENADRERPVS